MKKEILLLEILFNILNGNCFQKKKNTNKYLYEIIATDVHHTETGENLIVYKALYRDNSIYARQKEMFLSEVDSKKYPDIKQKYRLEKINSEDIIFKKGY